MKHVLVALAVCSLNVPVLAQNNSLLLDGDGDVVTIADHPSLEPPAALTIECWAVVTTSGPERILTKGDGIRGITDRSYDLSIVGEYTARAWLFFAGGAATSLDAPLPDGNWHHIALTFSSAQGEAKIFVDGVETATTTTAEAGTQSLLGKTLRQSSRPLQIGAQQGSAVWSFGGRIDSLRLWNVARTESEILCTINARLTQADVQDNPGLVSSWNFETGASDDVGSNHGTFGDNAGITDASDLPSVFSPCDPFMGTSLCSGDGGDQLGCTNCPCSNNAPQGTVGGCLNSAATSATLAASGDPSVSLPLGALTDLRFELTGAPPSAFCILNSGDGVAPSSAANPCFGLASGTQSFSFDGLRCAIQNTRRHGGRSADATGAVGVTNNPWGGEAAPTEGLAGGDAPFVAGQTRYFQVIHRDDPSLVCMRGLNTSQAVEITFIP